MARTTAGGCAQLIALLVVLVVIGNVAVALGFPVFALLSVAAGAALFASRAAKVHREHHERLARARALVMEALDVVFDPALPERDRARILDALGRGRSPAPDRFVLASELPQEPRAYVTRARAACETVTGSRVNGMGLLDSLANEFVLPQQIWEIARLVRTQAELEAEQRQARRGVVTEELEAVLGPQQEALQRSIDSVAERVRAMEGYARKVEEADAALRARDALRNNDKYLALLAQTDDADGLAALRLQAASAADVLAASVKEAVEAGRTLTLE
ncbi:hypothetical protein [Nonomuraea soli]|uniref:Uncharacterized protein n=1 Tax=Nonomuraea soli TaxID=1032476 RepID=A0A7W0HTE1_9ACTN|nr:hypothetical protein [Nonomuraea soli]MBA2894847.1 hypothetical protein [Nonomuraea soli]